MPSVTYGYEIRDGVYCTQASSSENVKMAYNLYLQGLSFAGVAQMLNKLGIVYRSETPTWNHNIVKRILQDKKYIGTTQYPSIVSEADYKAVQQMIASKAGNENRKRKTVADVVWKYMICGTCSNTFTLVDVRNPQKELAILRCKVCNQEVRLKKQDVEQALLCQINQHYDQDNLTYTPSQEVFRLDRMIDRGLEQPDSPDDVIAAILKGISARYSCCKSGASRHKTINRLTEMTPLHFGKTVSHISVSTEYELDICFMDEKGNKNG